MADVTAERDRMERVRLVAALRYLPDRYLSHKCTDGRWHSGCAGAGAAWDFILDRAVKCDCDCHQAAAQ